MKEWSNNLWWLLCLAALAGLMLWPGPAQGYQEPTPTLPPAAWMTPVSGEQVPGVAIPNYLLWGGGLLALLLLGGIVLLLAVILFARRRKAKRTHIPPASAFTTLPGYVLVVQGGPGTGTRYPVIQNVLTIGRDVDCQVIVNYPNVSAHHARLTWDGRTFVVEDMGSTNGTFVNGYRITGPVQFRPGDVLSLAGSVDLVLRAGG